MPSYSQAALLIIDVQNDFLPGGTLAVAGGDAIIAPINDLLKADWATIIATKDWHPVNHCSFKQHGGPWPTHCVAATHGAAFPDTLMTDKIHHIVHKGLDPKCDSYSAFFDNERIHSTGLKGLLSGLEIEELHICGLALDVCVKATIDDALENGFKVTLHSPASKGLTPDPTPLLESFSQQGVTIR
ncbi:nicotinamidase [Neokomagataea thailandica NBRC 106555]|uniref:nicotinamidase n=2 Tax=Neokomagataea TaxID=1223423 RepID=A0A4Y6V5I8_9PROT|nr:MULTISPECIES: nicotinamidase [Neokomagataea]QDH24138.1 nicotinamidase [Neokomagataea tanensis]GBR50489.1 nicotinamidase [Neokomagataea thailandica NBRC 106555]